MKEYVERDPEFNSLCFGCGENNQIGAKLKFYKLSEKSLGTVFDVPKTWGGWGNIMHGGLQTVILDEVSGWTVISILNIAALTIKAEMKFLRPLYVEEKIEAVATVEKVEGRDVTIKCHLKNSEDEICTVGLFTFREVKKEKIEKLAQIQF